MSVESISPRIIRRAAKEYRDSCYEWIMNIWDDIKEEATLEEIQMVEEAVREGWWIRRGELYEDSVNKQDGYIYHFRSKPGRIEICFRHNLFHNC